jgi:hypothetical protein
LLIEDRPEMSHSVTIMESEFEKLVQKYAKSLENYTIFNASTAHAIILFKNLLEVAAREKRPVKIFSGCFDPMVYDSLVEQMKKVIVANVRISLTSECEGTKLQGNSFVETIKAYTNGTVISLERKIRAPHFILVGNSSYRVELDDALKSATANFNDPATGATLDSLYDRLVITDKS